MQVGTLKDSALIIVRAVRQVTFSYLNQFLLLDRGAFAACSEIMSLISLAFSAADRMDVNWLSISGVGCYPPSWYLDICTQRKESFHKELIT